MKSRWFKLCAHITLLLSLAACETSCGLTAYDDLESDCLAHESYDPRTDSCIFELACDDLNECDMLTQELYQDAEPMLPQECLPGEQYDSKHKLCYINCDGLSEAACSALDIEVYGKYEEYLRDDFHATGEPADVLAKYNVNAGQLQWAAGARDALHVSIWDYIRHLLPAKILDTNVKQFHIFSDGIDGITGFVHVQEDDSRYWVLAMDPADYKGAPKKEIVHTIVHEFGHILFLNRQQLSEVGSCLTYAVEEGCASKHSYINQFFNLFWAPIYAEHTRLVDDKGYNDQQGVLRFYKKYKAMFVNDYAATNPVEDAAEIFTHFVLRNKPSGKSIIDQKILFMYQFPALVSIRRHIRLQLNK